MNTLMTTTIQITKTKKMIIHQVEERLDGLDEHLDRLESMLRDLDNRIPAR